MFYQKILSQIDELGEYTSIYSKQQNPYGVLKNKVLVKTNPQEKIKTW